MGGPADPRSPHFSYQRSQLLQKLHPKLALPDKTQATQLKLSFTYIRASLVVQTVKNLPAKRETEVHSLGREDSLEKGTATHSSMLAWRIPWTEEPGGLRSMSWQRVGHD